MINQKIIKVKGSHFECGRQIGEKCKDLMLDLIKLGKNDLPEGLTWQECLDQGKLYWQITEKKYPDVLNEVKGAAEGAELDPLELFTASIEELWVNPKAAPRFCSDIVISPPATEGDILVGHNNDVTPSFSDQISLFEWTFERDEPSLFSIGFGGFISIGINSNRIALTGSELTTTDKKIGVPSFCIARAILSAKTFDEAVSIATDPDRASSYNNIISSPDPEKIVAVEGSATDYELVYPEDGVLIHTNHYISNKMKKFEGHPNYVSSIERRKRIEEMIKSEKGPVSKESVLRILKDHGKDNIASDNTICRHGPESKTAFGVLMNLSNGDVEVALGNPCVVEFEKVWQID